MPTGSRSSPNSSPWPTWDFCRSNGRNVMAVAAAGMAASLVPAYIQCIDPDLPLPPINFAFNPEGYSITTTAHWQRSPQPASPAAPQFKGIEAPKLDVKILMDAFAVPPIPPTATIEQLKLLLLPTALSVADGGATAPIVMFGWGTNIIMDMAVVTKVVGRLRALPARGAGAGDRDGLAGGGSAACSAGFHQPHVRWPGHPAHPDGGRGRHPGVDRISRNTRIPTNGGPWPKPTTSTTRCA